MSEEYFYGVTLSKKGETSTWDPAENHTSDYPNPLYKLIVKQALLGHTANEDEVNVVEVDTKSTNDIKIPIAVLKAGECRAVQLNLEFPDSPVSFKLIEGNGPVYIHCQHVPRAYEEEFEEIEEMAEEEISDEEALEDEEEENPRKRQKVSNHRGAPSTAKAVKVPKKK